MARAGNQRDKIVEKRLGMEVATLALKMTLILAIRPQCRGEVAVSWTACKGTVGRPGPLMPMEQQQLCPACELSPDRGRARADSPILQGKILVQVETGGRRKELGAQLLVREWSFPDRRGKPL